MALAMDAVVKDGLSVRKAAEEYGVPKSTLGDRISGRILPGAQWARQVDYLTHQEEEELVCFLLRCASIGYPRSRLEVIAIVQRLCDRRGLTKVVSHGWWESFCRRHRNITLRVPAPLSLARAKASDVAVINNYFDMLETTLVEYDLLDKPCQLFNIDETGLPLDPKSLKVVSGVGTKKPSYGLCRKQNSNHYRGLCQCSRILYTSWLYTVEKPLAVKWSRMKFRALSMAYPRKDGWTRNCLTSG